MLGTLVQTDGVKVVIQRGVVQIKRTKLTIHNSSITIDLETETAVSISKGRKTILFGDKRIVTESSVKYADEALHIEGKVLSTRGPVIITI